MAERTRGSGSQHNGGSKYVAERSRSQTLWHRATNYPGTHGYLCFLRNGCGGFGRPRGWPAFFWLVLARTEKHRTGGDTSPDHTPNQIEILLSHPPPAPSQIGKRSGATL